MRYGTFGGTDLRVSELGFGGSRIGGVFAGKGSSSQDAQQVLRSALDAGINFFDTADMYSGGEVESLMGRAFRGRRGEVVIATKGGFCLPARRNLINRIKPLVRPVVRMLGLKRARLPAGMSGALTQDFTPAYLARALEGSLKRLKTDHVDLYQLHSPSIAFMQSAAFLDALAELDKLRTQGKLRFHGVATEMPADAPHCLSAPGISSLQIGFGVLDPEAGQQGTLEAARQRGLGIIARGCFGGGLLKDGLDEATLRETTPKWRAILALREVARASGRHPLEMAYQFCRGNPAVSVTLVGIRLESHLRECLRYVDAAALDASEEQTLRGIHLAAEPA